MFGRSKDRIGTRDCFSFGPNYSESELFQPFCCTPMAMSTAWCDLFEDGEEALLNYKGWVFTLFCAYTRCFWSLSRCPGVFLFLQGRVGFLPFAASLAGRFDLFPIWAMPEILDWMQSGAEAGWEEFRIAAYGQAAERLCSFILWPAKLSSKVIVFFGWRFCSYRPRSNV